MKIIYKTGSLMDATENCIIHQVNQKGKFRSGIAKLIREQYPLAYQMYMITYETYGLTLGDNIYVPGKPHTVINACAQPNFGYDGELYTDYAALASCLEKASLWIADVNAGKQVGHTTGVIEAVAFGRIGCGLAGGSWQIVEEIIELCCIGFQPVVYTLEGDTSWKP